MLESHSSEPSPSLFPFVRETTALPSCQNSTRSKPAGQANPLFPVFSGRPKGSSPRIASSRGENRRSSLSMASPSLRTFRKKK